MKPVLPVLTTLLTGYVSSSLILAAAPPAARLTNSVIACQIIEQGANHRRWQKIVRTTDAQGNSFLTTNRDIVELATGLNYRDPVTGQWQPAKEEIDPAPGGAIAPFGQHQVSFADNLNAANAIVVQMSNGQTLQSGILGLSYYDTASGRSVMIAEIKDCQGQIVGSNQVLYTDAFNGVSANVRYTYTKAGLEQDVVLLKQPPVPETFGLSSATTVLQVLTEFSAAPQPQIRTNLAAVSAGGLPDESLDFGPMRLIRGKAFLLGTNFPAATVSKQWVNVNGRAILVESVRLGAIQKSLAQLPQTSRADEKPTNGSVLYAVSTERLLPARQPAKADPAGMALAKTMPSGKGLVLDYVEVNGNLNNYTFASGTTYFVSGPVYCSGTTTIAGGAVIKYPNDTTAFIEIDGPFVCQTAPYQPAIFTAGDDDRVGESLNGVWGGYTGIIDYPSGCTGGYGDPMLSMPADFEYGPWNMKIKNLRIYYARQVFEIDAFNAVTLSDSEVTNCGLVAVLDNSGNSSGLPLICNNCLFSSVATLVVDNTDQANYYHFNNCTIDHCPYIVGMEGNCGIYGGYYQDMVAVNCIFSSSGDENLSSLGGDYNGFYQSPLYLLNWWDWDFGAHQFISTDFPFQTAPEGDFYLTANCPFRNVGTTQIDSELLSDLQTLTTYAPQDGGQPDNDGMPDLGYHYPTLVAASVNAQLCPNSSLDVGAFNSNPDIFGLTLSYIIVGASSHGSLSGTPSDLIYTPNHCYEGSDSFTYKISDGFLTSPPATVTVAISDQVWANSDSWEQTCKNTTKQLNVSGGDSCGLPLTYRLVSGPSHAQSFSLSPDGAVSYTPVNGYCGTDSFRFQAVNPCGQLSAPATVTITVGDANPQPCFQNVMTGVGKPMAITLSGSDLCGDSLAYTITQNPQGGNFGVTTPPHLTYYPNTNPNFEGQDQFEFTVSDGPFVSSPTAVTIYVTPGPSLSADCRPYSIVLTWDIAAVEQLFNSGLAIAGFNVYRSTTSGGPYTLLTQTPLSFKSRSFSDTLAMPNTSYYYVVTFLHTDVDCHGNQTTYESPFSNEVGPISPCCNPTSDDLWVDKGPTPQQLAQLVMGPNVTVSNVKYTGDPTSRGIFGGGSKAGLPIDTGVIFATGDITIAIGPNNAPAAGSGYNLPGDSDLNNIISAYTSYSTEEAAVLEFDAVMPTNSITFQYFFASEEYPNYVNSVDDVCAIFVDGQNIALVPGGSEPVSVFTINANINYRYFLQNYYGDYPQPFNIQYNGLTTLLTAQTSVTPNTLHHIKIAVANTYDNALDSAILIKAQISCP